MAALKLLPADAVTPAALTDAFNASFADYLLRFAPLDGDGWLQFVQRQGSDLALGRVALRGDEVVAFVLVTPRPPGRSRIAVMGARPTERGSGVAAGLLDDTIAAARERAERSIELEVFAQNTRALALYRSRGFEQVGVLYGYLLQPAGARAGVAPTPVSRDAAVQWLDEVERDDPGRWPWQVTGQAVAAAPGELSCWRSASAQLVSRTSPEEGPVGVVSLIDRDPSQAGAVALLTALRARHPQRVLQAPQLQRDDGPALAFEAAGWTRQPLHQLLLRLHLGAAHLGQSPP